MNDAAPPLVAPVEDMASVAARIAALESRVAQLEARLASSRSSDASALICAIREHFPAGVLFTSREVIAASHLDTALALALRAELAAARIKTARQLGKLLRGARVERVGTIREGSLWRI